MLRLSKAKRRARRAARYQCLRCSVCRPLSTAAGPRRRCFWNSRRSTSSTNCARAGRSSTPACVFFCFFFVSFSFAPAPFLSACCFFTVCRAWCAARPITGSLGPLAGWHSHSHSLCMQMAIDPLIHHSCYKDKCVAWMHYNPQPRPGATPHDVIEVRFVARFVCLLVFSSLGVHFLVVCGGCFCLSCCSCWCVCVCV